jgi:hypothetical protein
MDVVSANEDREETGGRKPEEGETNEQDDKKVSFNIWSLCEVVLQRHNILHSHEAKGPFYFGFADSHTNSKLYFSYAITNISADCFCASKASIRTCPFLEPFKSLMIQYVFAERGRNRCRKVR